MNKYINQDFEFKVPLYNNKESSTQIVRHYKPNINGQLTFIKETNIRYRQNEFVDGYCYPSIDNPNISIRVRNFTCAYKTCTNKFSSHNPRSKFCPLCREKRKKDLNKNRFRKTNKK